MPIFLSQAAYTPAGVHGLIKEGGTKRRDAIQALVEKSGGKLIGFYFAYGEADAYVITEYPDRASALALSIAVNASGAVRLTQIELMLPEEVDAAITKLPAYRAPGT
jgi:uncharacterized protein with GYD domain